MTTPSASDPFARLFHGGDGVHELARLRARLGPPQSYRVDTPACQGAPVIVRVRWACGCSASGVRYENVRELEECDSHARTASARDATNAT